MNEDLIKFQLDDHENQLKAHSVKLEKIEQQQTKFSIQIENLCSDLKDLTGALKWLVGVLITTLIGFFIYMVQSGLIK
ncbi:hemolysin XhlA family protein [Clostridioides mangenotii]|uniref:hemolysin XhlA family protein n=1 Tax=Metaclostridioides mangenotii TaxID=1540 RepID=UPI001C10DCDC|nr:hemolysin XhlA family protein [Clostridioides mangenotii]MBU5307540.1 hemolysin XhlA family protein [Clostridioides mangenotii]